MGKETSILIVDDEETVRRLLATCLGREYTCVSASTADEAVGMLGASYFNLVFADIVMPGTSGLELCQYIQSASPETVVILVSGMTDIQVAIQAMRNGAFDFITKPFDLQQVMMAAERALRYQALLMAKKEYEESLEDTVRLRTDELRSVNESLNGMLESLFTTYRATLRALARALEARDVEMRGHSDRVTGYTLRLGKELGYSQLDMIALEQGALLHDIGKIGVREAILLKQGEYTDEERIEMRKHVSYGLKILEDMDFLSGAYPIVAQHHEKYDGSGYPAGISGDIIHINARIFAVADAFDAITSGRPYRPARAYLEAREEIIACMGTQFDPRIVKAFLNVAEEEWEEISIPSKSEGYPDMIIDKRNIRSFIISLKKHSGATGALNLGRTGQLPMIYAN